MCDFFLQRMDNYQGDLADIVRASAGTRTTDFPVSGLPEPMDFQPPPPIQGHPEEFGQPFANLRDPLLHEFQTAPFFDRQKMIPNEEMRRPANIFSRMLQISPGAAQLSSMSPRGTRHSPIVSSDMMQASSSSTMEHGGGLQISCPPSTTSGTHGIKRRKSQAKKVVCIPAPAAAGSRPTGEVIPSDLWAWRKYGQKPIKGSPYPRGYYRCSSSKGCSARKQVERSRTEPNMLVITYTSEHNHPWPTQRNALAGSTRSQPAKTSSSKTSQQNPKMQPATNMKEEPIELATSSNVASLLKEEADSQVFDLPMIPDSNQSCSDDLFADLAELDPDPMKLIFSLGAKSGEEITKDLDPFDVFDWGGNSFDGEAKNGL